MRTTWIASLLMASAPLGAVAQPVPPAAPDDTVTPPGPLQTRADVSADQAPPSPPPLPPPPPPGPSAELPKKLAVGKESPGATFVPGVLLQGWFLDDTSSVTTAAGDVTVSTSTFRLRRAEVSASGELIPKGVKYKVMFDPSRVRDTTTTTTAVDAAGKPVTVKTPVSALSTCRTSSSRW